MSKTVIRLDKDNLENYNHNDEEYLKLIDSYAWIEYLPDTLMTFPIQFANCERLRQNKAVYIFDQVGSGKTISSGLMALDYLWNNDDRFNPSKKILIITKNGAIAEQFLNDWFDKFPFKKLLFDENIEIINNHHSNIIKKNNTKYGLIIVDEADAFLNISANRTKALCNLNSDKIIFMTATPIRNVESNYGSLKNQFETYAEIANRIVDSYDVSWIDYNNSIYKDFNTSIPSTSYFTDVIKSLNIEGYKKETAIRRFPIAWEFDNEESKIPTMIQNIKSTLIKDRENNIESKFVIFVDKKEAEAYRIEEALKKDTDFSKFDLSSNTEYTYYIVTGDNKYDLNRFSTTNNLPNILILTHHIAGVGLNLPGFNYIVNYHIPPNFSSVEQRMGRIDRMNSKFKNIHTCYLISKENYFNINTCNFFNIINACIYNLFSEFPSKNCILTESILKEYISKKDYLKSKLTFMKESIDKEGSLIIENILLGKDNHYMDKDEEFLYSLFKSYIADIDLPSAKFSNEPNLAESIVSVKNYVSNKVYLLLSKMRKLKDLDNNEYRYLETVVNNYYNDKFSDSIIYKTEDGLNTITADKCALEISNNEKYITFNNNLNYIKNVIIDSNKYFIQIKKEYFHTINNIFEDKFKNSNLGYIFNNDNITQDLLSELLKKFPYLNKSDYDWLEKNIPILIKHTPFMINIRNFENSVLKEIWHANNNIFYDDNYDYRYFMPCKNYFLNLMNNLNLFANNDDLFYIEDNTLKASNWLKLLFIITARRIVSYSNYSERSLFYHIFLTYKEDYRYLELPFIGHHQKYIVDDIYTAGILKIFRCTFENIIDFE